MCSVSACIYACEYPFILINRQPMSHILSRSNIQIKHRFHLQLKPFSSWKSIFSNVMRKESSKEKPTATIKFQNGCRDESAMGKKGVVTTKVQIKRPPRERRNGENMIRCLYVCVCVCAGWHSVAPLPELVILIKGAQLHSLKLYSTNGARNENKSWRISTMTTTQPSRMCAFKAISNVKRNNTNKKKARVYSRLFSSRFDGNFAFWLVPIFQWANLSLITFRYRHWFTLHLAHKMWWIRLFFFCVRPVALGISLEMTR